MQIFFPKEEGPETRATILPEVAKKFIDLGIDVVGTRLSKILSSGLHCTAKEIRQKH